MATALPWIRGGPAKTNMKYEEEEKNKEIQLKPMAGFKDIYYIFEYLFIFVFVSLWGKKWVLEAFSGIFGIFG